MICKRELKASARGSGPPDLYGLRRLHREPWNEWAGLTCASKPFTEEFLFCYMSFHLDIIL